VQQEDNKLVRIQDPKASITNARMKFRMPALPWCTPPASVVKRDFNSVSNAKALILPDKDGDLPIHFALRYGAPKEILCQFLRLGPQSARHANHLGHLSLHQAIEYAVMDDITIVAGAYPGGLLHRDKNGCLPLHLACRRGTQDIVLGVLAMAPQCVSEQDSWGNFPLHLLCKSGASVSLKSLRTVYARFPEAAVRRGSSQATPFFHLCNVLNHCPVQYKNRTLSHLQFLCEVNPKVVTQQVQGEYPFERIRSIEACEALLNKLVTANPDFLLVVDNSTEQNNLLHLLYFENAHGLDRELTQSVLETDDVDYEFDIYSLYVRDRLDMSKPELRHLLIKIEPRLATMKNAAGELPLHSYLKGGHSEGRFAEIEMLLVANPQSYNTVDPVTKLVPFMLAAVGDRACITATFELLMAYIATGTLSEFGFVVQQ